MSFGLFRIFFATGGWGRGFKILQLPSLPLSLTETPSLHWKKKKKKSHRLFYIIPRSFFPDGLVKELKCVPLFSCYVRNDETGAISSWLQLLCFLPFGALHEVLDLSRGVLKSPLDCWVIIVILCFQVLRRIKGQRFGPPSPKGVMFN